MNFQTYSIPPEQASNLPSQFKAEFHHTRKYLKDALLGVFRSPVAPLRTGDRRPVILIPGWLGRTHSFKCLQERIHQIGHPVYIIPLGFQVGNILKKSRRLSGFLTENRLEDAYVVAHSMGGLISIGAMLLGERRISRLWTLGSPIYGTYVTYILYLLSLAVALWGVSAGIPSALIALLVFALPSLRQMTPGSDLLTWFSGSYPAMENVRCIFAKIDQIVITSLKAPGKPPRLGRDDDICLPEYGHANLFMGEHAIQCIIDQLKQAENLKSQI